MTRQASRLVCSLFGFNFTKTYIMRLRFIITLTFSFLAVVLFAQSKKNTGRQLYLTQIKAAEALLRLNETHEAKKVLGETNPSLRGFEWQLLHAMSDRSVQTLNGHSKPVVGIALSPDGKWLASGSADSSIILWEAGTGNKIATLKGHKGQVTSLDFNSDGTQLLSGSTDRSVKLWDVAGQKEITTIKKDFFRGIYQCKFSADGKRMAIATWEFIQKQSPPVQGFVMVLSLPDGNIVQRFNTDNHPASSIDFSPDGNKLYSATWGFYVKQHDIATGKDDWNYDINNVGYYAAFQSCDLHPDGKRIVTGGKDNQVRMLDASNGKLLYIIEPHKGHLKWVNVVRFSGDGKMFASASDDQLVKVWEAESGKLVYTFRGHTNNINGLAFSSDNKSIFTSSSDGTIKKWDITDPGQYSFDVCNSGPWNAPMSPDGKRMAAACSDTVLNIWNLQTKTIEQSYSGVSAIAAVYSPDGKYLASGNNRLNIFDLANKKMIANTAGHKSRITGMDWSAAAKQIATASGDGTIRIWNEKGDSMNMIRVNGGTPYTVSFTPDGKTIVAGLMNGKVKMYNTANWQEKDSAQMGTTVFNLSIDPAGRYAVTGGNKEAWLWDMKTKKVTALNGHSNWVYGVAFHPSGKYAITASYDLSVKIWDIATGDCVLTLKEFKGELYTTGISKDGKQMMVGEAEGQIYIIGL